MKTVFINCSPKKRFCASSYFLFLEGLFLGGEKVRENLRNPADYDRILSQLQDAQTVVFGVPLYVDGIPSHVLSFLQKMEAFCREKELRLNVYVIANNGFIEGKQNEPLMRLFGHFCARAGLSFCGGVGVGGGVMLNVTRILFVVQVGLLLLNTVLSAVKTGDFFPAAAWSSFLENAGILLFLNLGVLFYLIRMARCIRKDSDSGKRYTRIMVPSFLFILFADIFFIIISVLQGSIFRGWLSKKQPEA